MKDFDLYPILTASTVSNHGAIFPHLSEILVHPRVSALRLEEAAPLQDGQFEVLTRLLHQNNVALILSAPEAFNAASLPLTESDGVHFAELKTLKAGLPALKPLKLQAGCFCKTLDDAMYAGEAGADYISLPAQALEAIGKWSAFAELPCVAEHPANVQEAREAVEKGADFISFPLTGNESDLNWLRALTDNE
ncbi:thiamine phosphate synthase [Acetobacteraceae bacterium ESL0709]|nr:thiamine phosphate synthase [Acetobacteraceae bacterium ESL0697]MDF7678516.1 thiamine phosphate synthase [Acetobacteraceae bacterium ESL0709]